MRYLFWIAIWLVCPLVAWASPIRPGAARTLQLLTLAGHSQHRDRDDADDDDDDDDEDESDADIDVQVDMSEMADQVAEAMREVKESTANLKGQLRGLRVMGKKWNVAESDECNGAEIPGQGNSAKVEAKSPVEFRLNTAGGDIEVVGTSNHQVTLTVTEARLKSVGLVRYGENHYEGTFDGRSKLRHGKVHLELPVGSRVDISSVSGNVSIKNLGGDASVKGMSADVDASGVKKVDIETVDGAITLGAGVGQARIHTVSGEAKVKTTDPATQIDFETASGDFEWTGICGKGCRITAETVSGDIKLRPDPRSSFELNYVSHSGELRDDVKMQVTRRPKENGGGWVKATFGKGEGSIDCDGISANLYVSKP